MPIEVLVELVSIGTLLAFFLVCCGMLLLFACDGICSAPCDSALLYLVSVRFVCVVMIFVLIAGVLVLRYTKPDLPRPFRCPCVPAIPIAGAFICLMLMVRLFCVDLLLLIFWIYSCRCRGRTGCGWLAGCSWVSSFTSSTADDTHAH